MRRGGWRSVRRQQLKLPIWRCVAARTHAQHAGAGRQKRKIDLKWTSTSRLAPSHPVGFQKRSTATAAFHCL
jgi:hypothetical protein